MVARGFASVGFAFMLRATTSVSSSASRSTFEADAPAGRPADFSPNSMPPMPANSPTAVRFLVVAIRSPLGEPSAVDANGHPTVRPCRQRRIRRVREEKPASSATRTVTPQSP